MPGHLLHLGTLILRIGLSGIAVQVLSLALKGPNSYETLGPKA